MIWQDIVFAVGSWLLSLALLPSVIGAHKPARSSSLLTATILTVYAFTWWSQSMYAAAVSGSVTAALWYVLAAQKARQR
ncbi:MAG: hypothetical protein P3T54_00270 [Dehalogenimonas sp.]|nr:hypothetical protein [Dehalogenimonas sp.]